MNICKLSVGLEKLKFDKTISMLQNNYNYWFIVRGCKSRYYFGKSLSIQEARVALDFHLMLL